MKSTFASISRDIISTVSKKRWEAMPQTVTGNSSNALLYIVGSIVLLLLACMLVYPFGPDQAIFSVGGELIFTKGALPYRDFLESKPPLIFYVYGLSQWLFGYDQWAIRLFDMLLLSGCFVYYYVLLVKLFGSKRIAILSVLTYAVLYVAGGYWETAQCESFAFLPSLLILHSFLLLEQRSSRTVLLGCVTALSAFVLFLLKFTLAYTLVAYVLYLFLYNERNGKDNRKFALVTSAWFMLFGVIFYLGLTYTNSFNNFISTVTYVKDFAYGSSSGLEIIKRYFYQLFPSSIVISFSPTIVLLFGYGVYRLRRHLKLGGNAEQLLPAFFVFALCQICFGLLSILVERKFAPYNYQRLYWCVVPFVAFAIDGMLVRKDRIYGWPSIRRRMLSLVLLAVLIFYSPLPRLVYHPLRWGMLALTGNSSEQDAILQKDSYNIAEIKSAASFIQNDGIGEDDVFVWGNTTGLYALLQKVPSTICLANGQFIPGWPPAWWKAQLIRQLNASKPKYFVVEQDDARPELTGITVGSQDYLRSWTDLRLFLEANYSEATTVGHFRIYRRM